MSGWKRAVLLVGIPMALLAIPFGLTQTRGTIRVTKNICAADGTCCPEPMSICGLNGHNYANYYYKSSGSCQDPG